mmetsp:Transcript_38860/g.82658  ORF Transcript_38860/g.82658 Transcript_38860/m.82658 type:complete len:362 (+) Transcript_38860:92-1177(+)
MITSGFHADPTPPSTCRNANRARPPSEKPHAAGNSREAAPPGAGCCVAVPSRRCQRWTSPPSATTRSSSPAKARLARPAEAPGGARSSPAGLQPRPLRSSLKSVTAPGLCSRMIAKVRASGASANAAAAKRALPGKGKGVPATLHGHVPSSVGLWPGQVKSSPPFVMRCKPPSLQAAPASGPKSLAPSKAKDSAGTISAPPSWAMAPKPRGVKATTTGGKPTARGRQRRCRGSKKAGQVIASAFMAGAIKDGGNAVAGSCLGPGMTGGDLRTARSPSLIASASHPSEGSDFIRSPIACEITSLRFCESKRRCPPLSGSKSCSIEWPAVGAAAWLSPWPPWPPPWLSPWPTEEWMPPGAWPP